MTRTKNWLLIGTILPAIAVAQSGFAAPPAQMPVELAQAPAPSDEQPEQERRERATTGFAHARRPGPPGH